MRIPRKISLALARRTRLAEELQTVCTEIDTSLLQHDIDPGQDNYLTGCAVYSDPRTAEKAVRMAIDTKD